MVSGKVGPRMVFGSGRYLGDEDEFELEHYRNRRVEDVVASPDEEDGPEDDDEGAGGRGWDDGPRPDDPDPSGSGWEPGGPWPAGEGADLPPDDAYEGFEAQEDDDAFGWLLVDLPVGSGEAPGTPGEAAQGAPALADSARVPPSRRPRAQVASAWDALQPGRSVRDLTSKELGRRGEAIAAIYLVNRGYEIVERNYSCPFGEADIIAKIDDEYVLVEVKTRLSLGGRQWWSLPELAVDEQKQARYRRIALCYSSERPNVERMRFDVVAINVVGEGSARLRHLVGAFPMES